MTASGRNGRDARSPAMFAEWSGASAAGEASRAAAADVSAVASMKRIARGRRISGKSSLRRMTEKTALRSMPIPPFSLRADVCVRIFLFIIPHYPAHINR